MTTHSLRHLVTTRFRYVRSKLRLSHRLAERYFGENQKQAFQKEHGVIDVITAYNTG